MGHRVIVQKNELGNVQSSFDYFLKFDVPKNAKILDIGCNYGSLIYNLYKQGYHNVYGIDVNKKRLDMGKQKYVEIANQLSVYPGDKIPFESDSFDIVLMFDVIEHIPYVQSFLSDEVHRVLRKGGLFVFQTPNKYINIPWEILQHKSLTRWRTYHCSLQTKGSLKHLLRLSKFKSIVIEKNNIYTAYNRRKVKQKIGRLGIVLLWILQNMHITMFPNFWGYSKK